MKKKNSSKRVDKPSKLATDQDKRAWMGQSLRQYLLSHYFQDSKIVAHWAGHSSRVRLRRYYPRRRPMGGRQFWRLRPKSKS